MTITTVTSYKLNQDFTRAKRATKSGFVSITDRGKPVVVLLRIEDHRRLAAEGRRLLEALSRMTPDTHNIVDSVRSPPASTRPDQPRAPSRPRHTHYDRAFPSTRCTPSDNTAP